jgi:hypothetical protein
MLPCSFKQCEADEANMDLQGMYTMTFHTR